MISDQREASSLRMLNAKLGSCMALTMELHLC